MASIYSTKIASDILAAIRKELDSFRKYVLNSIKYQTITQDQISPGVIVSSKIAASAITAEKIDAGAVTADKIKAKSITTDQIAAKTITADNMVAGTITAESAIIADAAITEAKIGVAQITATRIKDGSISDAHIQDASITSAKIVSLNADVITAGTLSVERLLIVGADSIVYEINANSSGLTSTELTDEEYKSRLSGKVIVAKSITAEEIDVNNLFADEATIDALKTMTVSSLLNGSVLILNENRSIFRTPEFLVEIPGAEDGEEKLRINAEGLFAPSVESPTVAKRHPGGVYRVGNNFDYQSLSDAFGDLEGAVLDGPVVLKLGQSDPGGALRGVRGGHDVTITSGNLIEMYAIIENNAALSWEDAHSYRITATSAGTYRYVRVPIGRIGDLGLAGKTLSVGVGAITNYGGTRMGVALNMYDGDYQSNPSYRGEIKTQNTAVSYVIPSDADDDRTLALVLYVSGETSCAQGAYIVYDRIRVEIGETNTMFSWPTAKYNIADFEAVGCDRVHMARVSLPTGARIRDSDFVVSRSDLYGEVGVLADMARVRMHNNTGNCTKAVKARCAQVYVTGPAPGGTYEGWLIDTTTAQISGGGSASTEITKTLTANSTGTYGPSSWWSGDRAIRQGYTTSNGRMRGGMWWDFGAIPAGATITAMKLTIKRTSGFGKGDNVTLKAYGTNSNARSGQPALTMGPYTLGEINSGQTKTFTLPAALVTAFKNGTVKGIVLYADDTSVLSGKTYSTNYARFDGTDGTAPKLAVTYTT